MPSLSWIQPIFDRTQADVEYAKTHRNSVELKGAQNALDWNRLTNNIHWLSQALSEIGYIIHVNCKLVWEKDVVDTRSEIVTIKEDLERLLTFMIDLMRPVPELPFNTFAKINIIESYTFDLWQINLWLNRYDSDIICGTSFSGNILRIQHFTRGRY